MEDQKTDDPFLVKPETDEYDITSFLVRNQESSFTPSEIASTLDVTENEASRVVSSLYERDLASRSQGSYYVDAETAKILRHRLTSVDSAERLHTTAPDNDAYAEDDWEDDVASR
ncbi:MarR family transcriptional regulator [Haloarcula montana]|uniref:MarR family transcriptional regulator n=1 Tax=Haloarcula montana TaxID=3111776 RepID=UPI002D791F60|nr:MarR family transcriptional regulator [Haloarcula sp. GH36]